MFTASVSEKFTSISTSGDLFRRVSIHRDTYTSGNSNSLPVLKSWRASETSTRGIVDSRRKHLGRVSSLLIRLSTRSESHPLPNGPASSITFVDARTILLVFCSRYAANSSSDKGFPCSRRSIRSLESRRRRTVVNDCRYCRNFSVAGHLRELRHECRSSQCPDAFSASRPVLARTISSVYFSSAAGSRESSDPTNAARKPRGTLIIPGFRRGNRAGV